MGYQIFGILVLACLIGSTLAAWTLDKPFEDAVRPGVTFYSSNSVNTRIMMEENMEEDSIIAKMNFDDEGGMLPTPNIESFTDQKDNSTLGAHAEKIDGEWFLVIGLPQDYEIPYQRNYGFYFLTGSPDAGPLGHRVELAVENLNDNPPVTIPKETSCVIDENTIVTKEESKCTFSVLDNDGSVNEATFTVSNPLFRIEMLRVLDPKNSEVALVVDSPGLDFEKFSLHILTIVALDAAANNFTTSYVVQVGDLPDTPPVWNSPIVPQTIVEESPATIQVSASDGDIGTNAIINYKLEFSEPSDDQYFSIDDTGLIAVKAIDRDILINDIFRFTVIAYEELDIESKITATMVVIIEDINDNVPEIAVILPEFAIEEGSAQPLGFGISVKDPDLAEFGQFNIELIDETGNNWNENFFLIPSVGYQSAPVTIAVKNPAALDYENPLMRRMTLTVVATEQKDATRTTKKDITITLIDINDEFPIFDETSYRTSLFENAAKGDIVMTVRATDADFEDEVTHSFTSQVEILAINPLTGVITVAVDKAFDYERQTNLVVQITAEDKAGHKTYAQLNIDIDDVNDTPPNLEMPTVPSRVEENTVPGPLAVVITASDVDHDADLKFDIDWTKSYATKQGARVAAALFEGGIEIGTTKADPENRGSATASLTIARNFLDYEAFDNLALSIVVEDLMTLPEYPTSRTKSAILSIEIVNLNDNNPAFTVDSVAAKRSVIENAITSQLIGYVVATDADGPDFNDVTYTIRKADPMLPDFLVMIDSLNGEMRVNVSEIDCDDVYGNQMNYSITASDGEPANDEVLEITIEIIDQNDLEPESKITDYNIQVMENSPDGFLITTVHATDDDFSVPFHTISYFIDAKDNPVLTELFHMDEDTGALTVEKNAVLDRDPPGFASYEIPIIFRDNYRQGNSAVSLPGFDKITVTLLDENDNAPTFPEVGANDCTTGCLACPLESLAANEEIITIVATDIDEGINAEISYELQSTDKLPGGSTTPTPANLFAIDATTGKITPTSSLSNLWGDFNVVLFAEDHGLKPQSSTKTYKICVQDINDHLPVIAYPIATESIRLRKEQALNAPLFDVNDNMLKLFTATDEDAGDNGAVTFKITGDAFAMAYFTVINNDNNNGELQLLLELQDKTPPFQLVVTASDAGTPAPLSAEVTVNVVVLTGEDVPPEFTGSRTWDVVFVENDDTQTEKMNQEAVDENNESLDPLDPAWDKIYYYIIDNGSPGLEYFDLNKETGVLSLKQALDREEIPTHEFFILATNLASKPNNVGADAESLSQLVLNVKVGDENDMPPKFDAELFPGGVSTGDKNGKLVLTISAVDPDENDEVTYTILPETIEADPTLENIKDNAFILHPTRGELTLNFDVVSTMSGFLTFQVKGVDTLGDIEGHRATTSVKVFVIADSNRVIFTFFNKIEDVNSLKLEIMEVFTRVIGFDSAIDEVVKSTDADGNVIEEQTEVTTHFIDTQNNQPVDNAEITAIVNNRDKFVELRAGFYLLVPPLELADYNSGNATPPQSSEALLRIILIAVSVILGLLVIILFAAFFIKTRSLNRRLEALSTTKFGSVDSGLNRVGMNVPGANKRAVEGSNPVWNEDIGAYDNISQASYDSDLIGVEENPEFNAASAPPGHTNNGFDASSERRPSVNPLQDAAGRRQSINPLSNGGTMQRNALSHQVSIDSQASDDNDGGGGGVGHQVNSNFTFATKDETIPVTEL